MATPVRKPKKQSQPVVIKREVREHHSGVSDRRRKCVVCELSIGDSPRTFTNHNGNIGMAHSTCAEGRADV